MPLVINPPHSGIAAWQKGLTAVYVTVLLNKKHFQFDKETAKRYALNNGPFQQAAFTVLVLPADGNGVIRSEDIVGTVHHKGFTAKKLPYPVFDVLRILTPYPGLSKIPEKIDSNFFYFFHLVLFLLVAQLYGQAVTDSVASLFTLNFVSPLFILFKYFPGFSLCPFFNKTKKFRQREQQVQAVDLFSFMNYTIVKRQIVSD
jgi:hypothetical protein